MAITKTIGGSALFVAESATLGGETPAYANGDVVVITPPSGQRVQLSFLCVSGSSSPKTGVSIIFGDRTVIDNKEVRSTPTVPSQFAIGRSPDFSSANMQSASGYLESVTGKKDEQLIINVSVISVGTLVYAYQFGE